jgi:hypothetical protein
MRLLRLKLTWGLCPQAPRICRFFSARMDHFAFQGTGGACPQPFRPLNRSLGLLPSRALSRPPQVIPGWTISTSPCNNFSANGDNPLNFVSHSRGSLHVFCTAGLQRAAKSHSAHSNKDRFLVP